MPHQTFKIQPGVQITETPAVNIAGISECQLIRYKPDDKNGALVEKLGGWKKFYGQQTRGIVRAIQPWEDTNAAKWVGLGQSNPTLGGNAFLTVLTCVDNTITGLTTATISSDITPAYQTTNNPPVFSTTAGSPQVTITDTSALSLKARGSVYIANHVSIGGLALFGLYQIDSTVGVTQYKITARDVLGQPVLATSSSTTSLLPQITATNGSNVIAIQFPNHGLSVGDTFAVITPITVGGIPLAGNYTVTRYVDASNFEVEAHQLATSTQTIPGNSGNVKLIYSIRGTPPSSVVGYGLGGYGQGGYGTGQPQAVPATATFPNATDWSLDNWGEILLSCPLNNTVNSIPFSPICQWSPTAGDPNAVTIPQSPPVNDGFFVAMPQRQIIAWGSTFTGVQDPLLLRWCDVNNFNDWIGTVINQAGSYRIPRGSRIVAAMQAPQEGLVWTDLGVWAMQYINQPYIYGFNELGTGCGLIARKAFGVMGGVVYWMGPSQFFKFAGDGVMPINCPIWDIVFQNLDYANLNKIRCGANSRFGEISWFYPVPGGSGEATSYVKYNVFLDKWDYGQLERSAWTDQSVVGPPLGASATTQYLYQHEISPDADDQAMESWFRTGFFALSDADQKIFVDEIWPDAKWGYYSGQQNATINLTFNARNFPGEDPTAFGPFAMTGDTKYLTCRVRTRLLQVEMRSNDFGSWWRMGGLRYRAAPDGRY